jgi:hypothetical protein
MAGKTLFVTTDTREQIRTRTYRVIGELGRDVTYSELINAMVALADNHHDELVRILQNRRGA